VGPQLRVSQLPATGSICRLHVVGQLLVQSTIIFIFIISLGKKELLLINMRWIMG